MQKFVDYIPVWLRRILCVFLPIFYLWFAQIVGIGIFADGSKNLFGAFIGTLLLPSIIGYSIFFLSPVQKVRNAKIGIACWGILALFFIVMIISITLSEGVYGCWEISYIFIIGTLHFFATSIVWISLNQYRNKDALPNNRLEKLLSRFPASFRWLLCVLLPIQQLVSLGTASKIVPWAFPYTSLYELCIAVLIPLFSIVVLPYYLAPKKKTTAVLCWMAVWQVFLTVCITYFYLNFSSVFPGSTAAFDSIIMQLFGTLALNLAFCAILYWILRHREKRKSTMIFY